MSPTLNSSSSQDIPDFATLSWHEFHAQQQQVQLDHVVHIPIQIRYIRVGQPVKGTVLLLHGIPTWGFL